MSNAGIMSACFFEGKVVLLKWLNDFFEAGYSKVEQTCTGALHCQILDAIYPGKVPLGKVNFDAKNEYEYVANYKVLQSVFDSQQITKHVDVSRLVKGKFQDNLEMLQWMKHFFDTHYGGQPYNAKERREEARAQYKKGHKHAGTGLKKPVGSSSSSSAASVAASEESEAPAAKPAAVKPAAAPKVAAKPAAAKAPVKRTSAAAAGGASKDSSADTAALTEQLSKLTLTIEGLEKERSFYFSKLREIEIITQEDEDAPQPSTDSADLVEFKKKVLAILYATDDNAEFQQPEDAAAGEEPTAEEPAAGEEGLLGDEELQQ